jgi:2'-5' RNA ligase
MPSFSDKIPVERSSVEAVILKIASVLKARTEEAKKSGKPSVFLGGDCSDDNAWRKDIVKEFGDKLAFIDPYDEKWEAEDNIYDELAALVGVDHVVFYKGGDGTKKEKAFLEEVGDRDSYESFDDLGELRTYLGNLSKPVTTKTANSEGVYNHSTTQIDLPDDLRDEVIKWGKEKIADKDLVQDEKNSMGREDEIHATVLYGLKDETPESFKKVVEAVAPFEARLGLVTLFKDNKEHDVVKIDIEAPELHRLHYEIAEAAPCENSFPTYVPHVTIAYVRKGAGDKVLGSDVFRGRTFKVDSLTFKDSEKKKMKIPLKGKS